jgi:methyl-accepting chemotaxis protein
MGKGYKFLKRFTGIKTKLVATMLVLGIIPTIIAGGTANNQAYKTLSNKLQITTEQTLREINVGIDNYLDGLDGYINAASENTNFKELLIHPDYEPFSLGVLENYGKSRKDVLSFYFALNNKKMIQYPDSKLPEGYDPTERPWYKTAIENSGKIIYTTPYKDADTGLTVVSICKTVENNGQVIGVIAMDIDLATFAEKLSNSKVGANGYVYVTDASGMMLAHPDKSLIGGNIVTTFSYWKEAQTKKEGFGQYVYKGDAKFVSYTTNNKLGWRLMGSLQKSELLSDTNGIKKSVILIVLVLGAIISVIAYVFSSSITKKIVLLKNVFKKTSEGDLTVDVNIKSGDEFEELATNFNSMIKNIAQLIENVKNSSKVIYTSSNSISRMAEETSTTISEISLTIDQVAQGASAQSNDIGEGVEEVNKLSSKIDNIDIQTDKMIAISSASNKLSEEGLEVMSILTDKTEKNNLASEGVAQVVLDMDSATNQIGTITDTINQIAAQTNLLALNAAIEAARAGEAGKGFSVVADEIRKLAEGSTSATREIQELIEKIKNKSTLAVKSMGEAKLIAKEQNIAVDQTKDIFGTILSSVRDLMTEIQVAKKSINETQLNKNEIVSKMQNISSVSEETTASAEEVSATTEQVSSSMDEFGNAASELNRLSKDLEEQINKFKI